VKTIAWSKLVREHRGQILAVGMCLLYLVVYLTTTHLKPQGMGGLSGPEEVRVFRSETHLVPFYPLYLLERWIRNQSFVYATYPFNCDFADHLYVTGYTETASIRSCGMTTWRAYSCFLPCCCH